MLNANITEIEIDEDNPKYVVEYTTETDGQVPIICDISNQGEKILVVPVGRQSTLNTITIPNTITEIGESAFRYYSALKNVTIGENVKIIRNRAFNSCSSLSSIDIPSKVETVESPIFAGCSNLSEIIIHKTEGSLTGAPWGATLGGRVNIVWQP